MFFNGLKTFLYSIFRILFSSYPEGSLSKPYRMGNRYFRADYSSLDGIAFAEKIPFTHIENSNQYQNMNEHIKFNLIDSDSHDISKKKYLFNNNFFICYYSFY